MRLAEFGKPALENVSANSLFSYYRTLRVTYLTCPKQGLRLVSQVRQASDTRRTALLVSIAPKRHVAYGCQSLPNRDVCITSVYPSISDMNLAARRTTQRAGAVITILIGQSELFCSDFALVTPNSIRNAVGIFLHALPALHVLTGGNSCCINL